MKNFQFLNNRSNLERLVPMKNEMKLWLVTGEDEEGTKRISHENSVANTYM